MKSQVVNATAKGLIAKEKIEKVVELMTEISTAFVKATDSKYIHQLY